MGLWRASAGAIRFDGAATSRRARRPTSRALGIAYVPENMGIFAGLTVRENLLLAARAAARRTTSAARAGSSRFFPALKKFWQLPAGNLSGGQKQMLAISRAIVEPRKLLLIDEPTKGLAPAIISNMIEALRRAEATRRPRMLVVEQNFHFARAARRRGRGDGRRAASCTRGAHGGARRRRGAAAAPARPVAGGAPVKRRALSSRSTAIPLRAAAGASRWRAAADRLSPSTWVTLTVAGLAMGMMIFIMASGLTLVFGLMDVLNFAPRRLHRRRRLRRAARACWR